MMDTPPNLQPMSTGMGMPVSGMPLATRRDEGDWNLRQLVAIAQRRILLITGVVIAASAIAWFNASNQTAAYQGSFRLLVEPVTTENQLDELTGTARGAGQPVLDYATQIEVLRSPELMRPIVNQIQRRYPEVSYGSLVGQLTVFQPKETKILEVRYGDTDPAKVKFVLEKVAEGYLRYSQQERQTNLRRGIEFVNNQLSTQQRRVDTLQRELQVFRQNNNFTDPDSKSQQVSSQITALEQQRLDIQKQLAETRAQYNNLQAEPGALTVLAQSNSYQQLLGQMREIDGKIATESVRFREGNPAIAKLQEQKQRLMPLLRQEARRALGNKLAEVENQLDQLEVRQQQILNTEQYWNRQFTQLPNKSRQFTDLQRELRVATDSLTRFLQTRESLQVEAAQKEVPWQLIAAPEVPPVPFSSAGRTLMLGTATAILLGILAAVLAERLDNTYHSTDDLKKQLRLPILGVIPFSETAHRPRATTQKLSRILQPSQLRKLLRLRPKGSPLANSNFAEAFRTLHANLRLLKTEPPIGALVISSALPGDGKSTVSVNLARAAAAMGQRVLLVDADLRKPRISTLLGLSNDRGLSDLLETDLHPNQAIQAVHTPPAILSANTDPNTSQIVPLGADNLFVLTSGNIPLDPTNLLSSSRMQFLSEHFQTLFDLVIYDSPPLLNLADSSLLAAHTEGIILVAGLGKTDRSALTLAIDSLSMSRIPVLGLVVNNLRGDVTPASNRYYYQT